MKTELDFVGGRRVCARGLTARLVWLGLTLLAASAIAADDLGTNVLEQMASLIAGKASRTPAQSKVDSHLLYALRQSRGEPLAPGVTNLTLNVRAGADGRYLVDIHAAVTTEVLEAIAQLGGTVRHSSPRFKLVRALLALEQIEALAALSDVKFIQGAVGCATSTGLLNSEGDTTHTADLARNVFRVNGAGIKVGVLSDSVDYLANSQATGDLPPVTILPGQSGVPGSGEGTAMLEIIHDLAPGSPLYFATAFGGIGGFAQNILNLRAAGCDVIVDDVFYFNESPFQDGPIAQAVNDVTEDAALYFSSAGNAGNKNDGTSGTWEGDFLDGGAAGAPVGGRGGRLHDFGGGQTYNPATGAGFAAALFWADPLGASTNDYDLFVVDSTGNTLVSSSTTVQNGTQDPYEIVPSPRVGERLVIVKVSGDDRYMHLDTIRGRLSLSTSGTTKGHSSATDAFSVAAVDVATAFPNPFVGGVANPVERFSSDGPRRVFYLEDGTPITPGDFLSTGGAVRQKPDIAAADGVQTTVPGFDPFFGTSAAAPHAAAIAALLKSYNPQLTPVEVRTILTNTALDIEAAGVDRDSGAGIVMAQAALAVTPPPIPLPNLVIVTNYLSGGNGNGIIDFNECNDLELVLTNIGVADATGIRVTLSTTTPQVAFGQRTTTYPNLPVNAGATNETLLRISTSPLFVCGTPIDLQVLIKCDQATITNTLRLPTGVVGVPLRFDNNMSLAIPDDNSLGIHSPMVVSNLSAAIFKVAVSVFVTHTYDSDLTLELISPDGVTNTLASGVGGSGDNFGLSCWPDSSRTTFDDDAANTIATGVAPFWGTFRPAQPLAAFAGKSGTNVNGSWQLRIVDNYAFDTGTLECWSLWLYSAECLDGGGQCPGVDLAVGMSASPDPVFIGSNLVYTITVTNFGPDTAKGVSMVQLLPPSVVFVSATVSQGSIGYSGGTVTANLGNLGAGALATATVVVTPATAGTISCTASVASAGPETDPSNNQVTITTRVRPPTAEVAVSLADSPDPVLVGQALIYTVTVANNGPSPASGVVVTSALPSTVVFQSALASQGNASYAGGVVTANLGTVTNGGSATVAIVVTPTAVGLVTAMARVSANQADPLPANNTASTTTVVGPAADLVVSLTDSPDPVVLRSNLTYVVSVTNRGPSVATGATLTHTLPGGVTVVATNVTQGTMVRNGNVVTASLGALAVGADAQLTVVVTSPNVGTLVSSATATASAADPNLANNTTSATTSVLPPFVNIVAAGAKLTAENLSPTNGAVDIGETVTLQLRLRNAGNAPNTNLVATLLATGGVASPSGPQTYGVLAPSGDTVARPFTFTASGDYGGTVTATLQLQDGPNNLGPVTFSFALPVVLTFANTAPITIPDSGAAALYPSVITVSGVTSLVDKVTVTLAGLSHTYPDDLDVLLAGPHGQKTILMSDSGGGNSLSGATIAFDDGGGFLSDEGSIVSTTYAPADYEPGDAFPGTPPSPPAGPYPAALAGCNSGSPNGSWSLYVADDSAGDAGSIAGGWSLAVRMVNPVNQVADLALTASAAPDPVLVADALTYTFTVTNGGPNTATGVSLTNALPAGVTLISAAASQGTWQMNGSSVVASLGNLALGNTATITVGVVPGVAGSLTNTASVAASENDLNAGNNAATAVTAVGVPIADVGVTKLAAPEPITVGSNLTYTITITNRGPNAALGVVASDTLPAGLTFVSADSSVGVCMNVGSLITCSLGNLASRAEASVIITATATVTGSVTNTVSVVTASSDANPADNMASIVSSILAPAPKIAAAGMALVSESRVPANGVPDPGETVIVSFALANVGAVDTANLVATLQSSGDVTSLSTPQSYGALVAGGPSGSANFIFTATGPNGGSIVATLQLQDGGNNLGSVSFTLPLPTTTTLANTNAITIPDSGGASLYPSSIVVSGLTGLVGKVTVTLNQLSHNFPDDLDLLLVGPLGQRLALMSDAGGGRSLTNVDLTFDDAAVAALPDAAQIVAGAFKPTDYEPGEAWPAPAPAGVAAGALSVFNGASPNGTWSLYVADDSVGDAGQIAGGWSLAITTVDPINGAANLQAAASAAPASVPVGSTLVYTLRVTNLGPATATGVVMTDPLPLGLSFLSVSTSQGAATNIGGTVTCDFGSLAAGAGAIVTIQVTPTVAGWLTNTFNLSANELDLNPGNNTVQAVSSAFNMVSARLAIEPGPGGQYVITLTGQPGLPYMIQASTDLASWLPVFTDTIAPNGTLKYTITSPESFNQRYYRGVFVP